MASPATLKCRHKLDSYSLPKQMTSNSLPCRPAAKDDLLFVAVLCFAAGLGAADLGVVAPPVVCAGLATTLAGGGLLLLLKHRRLPCALPLLGAFFLCAGLLYGDPGLEPPRTPCHIARQIHEKQEVSLIGVLARMPTTNGETSTLIVSAKQLIRPAASTPAEGLVRLTMPGPPPDDLMPGDQCIARTTLSPVRPATSPGAFDYRAHLARQGIWIKGWVPAPVFIARILTLQDQDPWQRLRYLPERLRYHLGRFLDQTIEPPNLGVYKAILLGETSEISEAVLENFKATGVMHLLAISGLHMGLLAWCCASAITWLLKRSPRLMLIVQVRKIAALATLLPLTGYALIAGFHTPVIRSLIMVVVFILALVADRQWAVRTNLAIAALLILLVTPEACGAVSFQLSFAAVLSIACAAPYIMSSGQHPAGPDKNQRLLGKIWPWLRAALLVSLAAMAGTLPLMLYHFNRFSPIAPLATLLVEPFLCIWTLLLGLAAGLVLPFSTAAAALLLKAGAWGLVAADLITTKLAALPLASIWLPTPGFWEITWYYLGLASIWFLRNRRLVPWVAATCLLLLSGGPIATMLTASASTGARVSVVDVGDGSAVVMQLPHGRNIVVDCGSRGNDANVGSRLVAPLLWKNRTSRVEQIIVSHPHTDHFNGVDFLLQRFHPKILWVNGTASLDPEYGRLLDLARHLDIEIRVPQSGEVLYTDGATRLQNLAGFHLSGKENQSPNQQSLVLRLEHGQTAFLLPGDIGQAEEEQLVLSGRPLRADVLLAAHHGATSSNSALFLAAVAPSSVIVSGREKDGKNTYGWEKAQPNPITTWRTGRHGTVTFASKDGQAWTARPFLP